ncbi:hypothetical protein [Pseudactinotalea terrae]|uniref:hypothetical protein n=1 Tax=Pseudactinotalea terrae TaxID=1743262 RepID=UPI0012E2C367|nr:hypothetical protein [Pseudactinotalea terrae]
MTDISFRNRRPAGVRTGGQFATEPRTEPTVTLTTVTGGHEHACRAHAIGCAAQNQRDAGITGDPIAEGDGYLTDGTASCYCGTDTTALAPWITEGEQLLAERESTGGHEHACRAHAIGCAAQNQRDAGITGDPIAEGDGYLTDGTASCYCGTDTTALAPWITEGEQLLAEREEADRQAAELEEADRYAGQPSVDDFTPEQRKAIEATHRHAYDWAHRIVGNLGMETLDYAEDYASWVARLYMAWDCDDDALSDHPRMHREWDAERGANAAAQVATDSQQQHWAASMSNGRIMARRELDRTRAGQRMRSEFQAFRHDLEQRGIYMQEVDDSVSGRGWRITGLDGDRFGAHVRTGG